MSPKFTDALLATTPDGFEAATTHPFLSLAGTSTLPSAFLLAWLTQDRIYALNYVPFIGSLLSKTSLPTTADRITTLEWRIADCLIGALTNIRREVGMFEDVLRAEFGWKDGGETPRPETVAYRDLFAGASGPNQSLLVGMTALWATERCYLTAWRFARRTAEEQGKKMGAGDGDVLQRTLIPNWTDPEFVAFVQGIEDLTNELAEVMGVKDGDKEWAKCVEVWKQVVWAEERFWPDVRT